MEQFRTLASNLHFLMPKEEEADEETEESKRTYESTSVVNTWLKLPVPVLTFKRIEMVPQATDGVGAGRDVLNTYNPPDWRDECVALGLNPDDMSPPVDAKTKENVQATCIALCRPFLEHIRHCGVA